MIDFSDKIDAQILIPETRPAKMFTSSVTLRRSLLNDVDATKSFQIISKLRSIIARRISMQEPLMRGAQTGVLASSSSEICKTVSNFGTVVPVDYSLPIGGFEKKLLPGRVSYVRPVQYCSMAVHNVLDGFFWNHFKSFCY